MADFPFGPVRVNSMWKLESKSHTHTREKHGKCCISLCNRDTSCRYRYKLRSAPLLLLWEILITNIFSHFQYTCACTIHLSSYVLSGWRLMFERFFASIYLWEEKYVRLRLGIDEKKLGRPFPTRHRYTITAIFNIQSDRLSDVGMSSSTSAQHNKIKLSLLNAFGYLLKRISSKNDATKTDVLIFGK